MIKTLHSTVSAVARKNTFRGRLRFSSRRTDFSVWKYALEEREHAYIILNFLDDWNYPTNIGSLGEVQTSFENPKHVFEVAYKHEKYITKCLNDVLTIARNKKDNIAIQFLDWFMEEQREEEDKMLERLNRLRLAGDNMAAILFLDHEDGLE